MDIPGTDVWLANKINFQGCANAGIKFAYVRDYSGNADDVACTPDREGYTAVKIETGNYHVANYHNAPVPQADHMAELSLPFGLIPSLDFEKLPGDTDLPPRLNCLSWLMTFYAEFDKKYTGDSLFYCNVSTIWMLRPIPDWLLKRKLWLAYPGTWTAAMIAPWPTVTVHQYALDKAAPWASGVVDFNSCADLALLRKPVTNPVTNPVTQPPNIEKRLDQLEAWAVTKGYIRPTA